MAVENSRPVGAPPTRWMVSRPNDLDGDVSFVEMPASDCPGGWLTEADARAAWSGPGVSVPMVMAPSDLIERARAHLVQCGSCDAGLRAVIAELVAEIERQRAAWVGLTTALTRLQRRVRELRAEKPLEAP